MKKVLIIFLIIFNLCANESNNIQIYTNIDNPPYSYVENGELKGIYVSILKSIFHKINDFKLLQEGIDLKKAISKMKKEEILALNGVYYGDNQYIDKYSQPIFNENIVLMCNKNILNKKREIFPEDFYDLNISKNSLFLVENKKLTISSTQSTKEGILKLSSGEINCYIDSEFSILVEFEKLKEKVKGLENFENILTISTESVHIGFSKKENILKDNLIKKINLAIRVMKNSGEIDEIKNNYLTKLLAPQKFNTINAITYNWGGSYVSDKFDNLGLIPEIVSLAFDSVDININYDLKSSQYAYLLTKWGQKSFSFPFYKTKDNEQYMLFSDPVMFSEVVLLYSKSKFPNGIKFNSFEDLKNYKIGGVKGYFYEDIFIKNSLNYTLTKNFDELLDLLIFDKVDMIPTNLKVFIDKMQKKFPDKLDDFNFYNKKNFSNEAIYLIFPKNIAHSNELRNLFNSGLNNIRKAGILEKIFTKYGLTKNEYKVNMDKFKSYKKEYKKPQNNIIQFIANVKKEKKIEENREDRLKRLQEKGVKTIPLYVETLPSKATIQIMDIKDKFYQGIKLQKGIYRLKISKDGYKTLNKKVIIGMDKSVTLKFKLEKE